VEIPPADPDQWLRPTAVAPLSGDEEFAGTEATVRDFWTWGFSDLRANTIRGVLAEFLVARAVGALQEVRDTWDNYDVLAPDGTRIEVKSSAYLQSWTQKRHSVLSFDRLTGLEFDATTNEYSAERLVRADVFVFAVHTERVPESYDALDVSKWEFYVVPADAIRAAGTRTVGITWVRSQAGVPVEFANLRGAIKRAAETAS
jgi:hypothetical protein